MPDRRSDAPKLGVFRALAGRIGYAFYLIDRLLLHLDVATRPIADVKAAIREYWSTFSARPDEVVHALMVWEQTLLEQWVRAGDRLLLIGCGSGRELTSLLERGCAVVGVEPAAETLAIARSLVEQSGRQADLIQGFVEDVALPGPFDVCWFSYFSYSYIPDRQRRVALLQSLRAQLQDGGRIVVTCLSQAEPPRSRLVTMARAAGRLIRNDWTLDEGDVLLRAGPSFRAFHYQHVFTPAEVAAEARDAGLEVAASLPPEAFVLRSRWDTAPAATPSERYGF